MEEDEQAGRKEHTEPQSPISLPHMLATPGSQMIPWLQCPANPR